MGGCNGGANPSGNGRPANFNTLFNILKRDKQVLPAHTGAGMLGSAPIQL
jgi:hypothetical protein